MTLPKVQLDWTINVSSLAGLILFILSAVGGWYNLKAEVALNKATTEIRLNQLDSGLTEVKTEFLRNTNEIKGDLKELRNDVIRPKR